MKRKIFNLFLTGALATIFIGITGFAMAQDQPADNMEIVKEKIRSDKKVARYYQLESKIDAVMEYELARRIPLVK